MLASLRRGLTAFALVSVTASSTPDNLGLVFHSGFEPGTTVLLPSNSLRDLDGADRTFEAPNHWTRDLDGHPKIGDFKIELKAGNASQRLAEIIADPQLGPSNRVLQFWLREPHEPSSSGLKGRIQASLSNLTDVHAIRHRVRMRLGAGFAELRNYPGTFTWLTLFEYWNDPDWNGDPAPFRVTVNVRKSIAGPVSELEFHAKGQIMDSGATRIVWEETSPVPVPIGEWVTVDLSYREGDASSGAFRMTMTREPSPGIASGDLIARFGGELSFVATPPSPPRTVTVFDVQDFTRHPNDPTPGDGIPFFNPMKLYTAGWLVDWVRNQGSVLEVFWDDFELWFDE